MMISQMLKEKRKEYQLTQEQLAEKIFVSNKTISNWETGKTKPDIESLILLAKLFDLSLDNLLLEESDIVKSMNEDIKKGRNLKKIVFVTTIPLIILIVFSFWINYKGINKSIVPLDDLSNIEMTTEILTDNTIISGDVELKSFESVDFVTSEVQDNVLYLTVYKEPKIFAKKTDFTLDIGKFFKERKWLRKRVEKIVFVYWDTNELNGYSNKQLTEEFSQKTNGRSKNKDSKMIAFILESFLSVNFVVLLLKYHI